MSWLHPAPNRRPRASFAVTVALALGGWGCQPSGGPNFVGVLSLAVTTQSGPTAIAGNVPTPCELDVDFGNVTLGSESAGTIEIVNHDTAPVSFSPFGADVDPEFGLTLAVFQLPSIQPGASTSFPVTFQPSRSGTASSSFSIPTSLGPERCGSSGAVVIKLTGTGIAAGSLAVTPSSLDFGNVVINSTGTKTVMLSNASATPVSAISCVVSGADANLFTVSGCPATLAGNAMASLVVSFAPLALETRSLALLTFTGNDTPPATLSLAGEPIGSDLLVTPNPLDFGYVPPGTTAIDCITVSNQLSVPVTIESLTDFADDGAFSLSQTDDAMPPNPISLPITIAGGKASRVCFSFAPSTSQKYLGSVTLVTDDPSGVNPALQLTGWGGGPQITCQPPSLAFGLTPLQSNSVLSVTCTNTGTANPVNLMLDPPTTTATVFSAQFDQAITPYPLAGLIPGASVRIDVAYAPVGGGSDQGTLSIKSNGGQGQAIQIPLTGQGLDAAPCQVQVVPAQLDFGNVRAGGVSAPVGLEIENAGSDICLLSTPVIEDDVSGSFHILSTSIPADPVSGMITIPAPAPGVTSGLTVTLDFAPAGGGSFSGQVDFGISNPADPMQSASLKGTSKSTCLTAESSSLSFGTLGQDSTGAVCGSSSRSFTVFNTCSTEATLHSFALESGPGETGPQFSLADPGTPIDLAPNAAGAYVFMVSFEPTGVGTHTALLLASDGNVEIPISLEGSAIATPTVTDQFVVGPPQVDVLFVLDVATETTSETNLVNAAPGFLQAASGVDYRVALTTDNDDASVATAEIGRLLPCPNCSVKGLAPTIISPTSIPPGGKQADPGTALAELCETVPTSGFPSGAPYAQHFFSALYNALQNDPAPSVDFFRPSATFAAFTFNDDNQDDDSVLAAGGRAPAWYVDFFETVFQPQPGFSWNYASSGTAVTRKGFVDADAGQLPTNIEQMLSATGGIAVNTGDPSWETALNSFWGGILDGGSSFPLSGTPSQGEGGISVAVDGTTVNQLAASGNPNWTYVSYLNAIQFTANDTPKNGDSITVTYQVCGQ